MEAFSISLASRVTISLSRGGISSSVACVSMGPGLFRYLHRWCGHVSPCFGKDGSAVCRGGVGCPSPGWWVTPAKSPSHRGKVPSRGGRSACFCEPHTGADGAQAACTLLTVKVAGVVACSVSASQHGLRSLGPYVYGASQTPCLSVWACAACVRRHGCGPGQAAVGTSIRPAARSPAAVGSSVLAVHASQRGLPSSEPYLYDASQTRCLSV